MFKFVQTADGSPSVRVALDGLEHTTDEMDAFEPMHSLQGAFSETVYIYGKGIEESLTRNFTARVLSLGLGLGYNEILSAALFLKHRVLRDLAGGESFELVPELREWFANWALGVGSVPADFAATYEAVLERAALETQVEASAIRTILREMLETGRWKISGPMSAGTPIDGKFGMICFDAFSSKTSPDLWTEEFLVDFFARAAAPGCVVSTYACTGALKRALKQNQFRVEARSGFGFKRASTFAVRG